MSSADRRRWARRPLMARCWCEDGDVTLYSTVGNLSEGGLFVRTFAPLAQGRGARVRFQLDDGGQKIEAQVTVMWRRDAPAEGLPTGMGLRFTNIESAHLERIRRATAAVRPAG